jgi:hypothetical protein
MEAKGYQNHLTENLKKCFAPTIKKLLILIIIIHLLLNLIPYFYL